MDKCFEGKDHKFSNNKCIICQKRYNKLDYKNIDDYKKVMLYVFLILGLLIIGYICSIYNGSMFYRYIFMICVYVVLVIVFHILVIDKMMQKQEAVSFVILIGLLFLWSILLKLIFNLLGI